MPDVPSKSPENPEETPVAPAAPSPLSRLLALLPTLGIFAGVAAAAFALVLFVLRPLFPPVGDVAAKAKSTKQKFGRIVGLDTVVVNIAQTEGRRYLKATIQLEVPEEEKAAKEIEARKAQLLDLLIATLSKKSLTDLTSPDALDRLRTEVHERMIQELGKEKVRRVFITEFVVQ